MTASHCVVVSSLGSRLPEDDKQCTQAKLQAYVSSHVRQMGASSPNSNWSTRDPPMGRTRGVLVPLFMSLFLTWPGSCRSQRDRAKRQRRPATRLRESGPARGHREPLHIPPTSALPSRVLA